MAFEKPKLLFLTPAFPGPGRTRLTGGLVSNRQLCRALRDKFSITVLTSDDSLDEGEYDFEGIHYIVCRPSPPPRGLRRIHYARSFLRRMIDRHLEIKPLPSIAMATVGTVPFLNYPRLGSVKKVILCRAYEDFGLNAPWGVPFSERVQAAMDLWRRHPGTRQAYKSADLVVTNSRYLEGRLLRRFDCSRVEVVHPPMDFAVPAKTSSAPSKTVGFVSRNFGKNLEFVGKLAARMPQWTFRIFGEIPVSGGSRLPNLRFRGWLEDRREMYLAAKVWIVPSRWPEPFGRVAMEARAFGRHVLVASEGGLPEAVDFDPTSIVERLDVDIWKERIETLEEKAIPAPHTTDSKRHDERIREIFESLLEREADRTPRDDNRRTGRLPLGS